MLHINNFRFWLTLCIVLAGLTFTGLFISLLITKPLPNYYRTSYLEFALPPLWTCIRKGGEDITCVNSDDDEKDSIIILVAKKRNQSDNLEDYMEHLKEKRQLINSIGEEYESQIKYARKVTIGKYQWVDALHYGSETQNYYTRYLATNTSHIGVVITFSSHYRSFKKWNKEFEDSVKSLQIYQKASKHN